MNSSRIRYWTEILFYFISIFWGYIFVRSDRNLRAVLVPPTGPGSLGDQAMVSALATSLISNGFKSIVLVRFSPDEHWGSTEKLFDEEISWPNRNIFTWMGFARKVAKSSHFILIGADILDGKYGVVKPRRMLSMSSLATRLGLDVRICGFSFNENPNPIMIDAFKKMDSRVSCYLRDPLSASRFMKLTSKNANECADLAFLLKPVDTETTKTIYEWVSNERNYGRFVMAINLNYLPFTFSNNSIGDKSSILEKVSQNVDHLIANTDHLSVLFVPHDYRGKYNDSWFASEVISRLSASSKERTFLIERPIEASEVKTIAGIVDVAITGRMHFLIALLGQSTPSIAVTYQGKFQGLLNYFDIEGLTLNPGEFLEGKKFSETVKNLLENNKAYRKKIETQLPKIFELSRSQIPK